MAFRILQNAGGQSPNFRDVNATETPTLNQEKTLSEKLMGRGKDIVGAVTKPNIFPPLRVAGAVTGGISDILGAAIKPVVEGVTNVISDIPTVQKFANNPAVSSTLDKVNKTISSVGQKYSDISKAYPEIMKTGEDIGNVLSFLPIGKGTKIVGEKILATTPATAVKETLQTGLGDSLNVAKGTYQISKDILGRVPRAISRGGEVVGESALKRETLKTATPEIKQAIKSNLDERIINTVAQADNPTREAYKKVLDIAEESPKTIGAKKQPTIVGGELASNQYDIINSQKKKIGEKIGELAKNLSKTEKINMNDGFSQIDNIISEQGIIPTRTEKGVELSFSGSSYTPAERNKISELYNLATEGGETLSPLQIREKDKLFSKLKRQSNFEGVGNLIVDTPEGSKSLFDVFRDIYSSKLESISPEIKLMNNEYRKFSQITDDIENSILKTPNFNATKSIDPSEFAKVNLRRIFGESQSSPAFEAVADLMDKMSRELGYKGAKPKTIAEFAQEMRKLYPETIPKTGFTGGIKSGLGNLIETVSKAGVPNIKDQQKALRNLLNTTK